jgi:hypothetical protein
MHIDGRIHKHIDTMDTIEKKAIDEIERIYASMSIDDLITDPEETLLIAVGQMRDILIDDLALDALGEGIRFSKEIKQAKEDLVIQDTKQPDLNEELAR